MDELIDAALAMTTLPLTILMGVVALYWLSVLLGIFDLHLFDGDVDLDLDSTGFFGHHFGFGDAPFMLGFSLVVFFSWGIAVPVEHLIHPQGGIAWAGLAGIVLTGYVLAKFAAVPLGRIFTHFNKEHGAVDAVEGQVCTLLYDTNNQVTSQGRIVTKSSPVEINVRARAGQQLPQGSRVLVIEKAETGNYYYVETIEELER